MDRLILPSIVAGMAIIGLIRLALSVSDLRRRALLAHEFLEALQRYLRSRGEDWNAYSWLTHWANKMQIEMGPDGILAAFRPPFEQFM